MVEVVVSVCSGEAGGNGGVREGEERDWRTEKKRGRECLLAILFLIATVTQPLVFVVHGDLALMQS